MKASRKHLHRLDEITRAVDPPIYFITLCALKRKPIPADPMIAKMLIRSLHRCASESGWLVGRYVLMPDHVHSFCCPKKYREAAERPPESRSDFIGRWKSETTRLVWDNGRTGLLWQREFFDHLIRSDESYDEKWQYMMENPVRRGLCANSDEWKYQGEFDEL